MISVWHDIPLYVRDDVDKATGHLNFVCEIPRCSRKKFEIATKEAGNPIKQDEKKGLLREFKKVRVRACVRACLLVRVWKGSGMGGVEGVAFTAVCFLSMCASEVM